MSLDSPSRSSGSSPLARGLLGCTKIVKVKRGIIPARAGFTRRDVRCDEATEDHPRSRGVYALTSDHWPGWPGSSPLARGLRCWIARQPQQSGIIPARAGFTRSAPRCVGSPRDHPRSRGVYPRCTMVSTGTSGSSPLARGLLTIRPDGRGGGGIIPARAGFTTGHHRPGSRRRDHPRSRGVYSTPTRRGEIYTGSSPLARGLHLRILGIPTTSHPTRLRLPSLPT